MSNVVDFKCPCCGGYMEFDPAGQDFKCPYCGQRFLEKELQEQSSAQAANETTEQQDAYRAYHCQSCGAQIVTTDTTAATRCYYCHNPVVLQDRLSGEFKPDGVIPFELDKDGALNVFRKYIKGKKFVDSKFYNNAQLENFSGVYYPYWMGDVEGEASFEGSGTRVDVVYGSMYTTRTTKFYRVEREGRVTFRNMVRKALSSADRLLSEGIHPYRYDEIRDYKPGYLSGFMAEMRDVSETSTEIDMVMEAKQLAPGQIQNKAAYDELKGNTEFNLSSVKMRYVLLPAWVMTYKGAKDKVYYYMMNGQTGEVCGSLPVNKGKLMAWCAGVGAAVFAVLCAGGALLW